MGEWDNFVELARTTRSDFSVLLITFFLTVFFDLTVAVGAGLAIAVVLFVKRMEEIAQVKLLTAESDLDGVSTAIRDRKIPEGVLVFRIEGPFFFGVAEKLEGALEGALAVPRVLIFRVRNVPAMDASGLRALEHAWEKFHRRGTHLVLSGVQPQPMKILFRSGFVDRLGLENICANIDEALRRAGELIANP
jgi:SulP family sulfate permease